MDAERRFRCNDADVEARMLDGELMMVNLATGVYFSVDGVGAAAWQRLVAGHRPADIAAGFADRWGVARERALAELAPFVAALLERGLLLEAEREAEEAPELAASAYGPPVLHAFTDMEELLAADPPMPGVIADELTGA